MADLSFWSCGGRLRCQISRGYEKGVDDIRVKRADEESENEAGVMPAFLFSGDYGLPRVRRESHQRHLLFAASVYGAIKFLTVTRPYFCNWVSSESARPATTRWKFRDGKYLRA